MKNLNKINIEGNLTREPDLKYSPTGKPVCTLQLACNDSYKDSNSTIIEDPTFVRIIAWGKLGETCNEFLNKGSKIIVSGKLKIRNWKKDDGSWASITEIIAQEVFFRSSKNNQDKPKEENTYNQNDTIPEPDNEYTGPDDDDIPF